MMELLSSEKVLNNFEVATVDDLFVAVSGRKPTANAIIEFLKIKKPVDIPTGNGSVKTRGGKNACPVYCKGVDKIAISLANCCTPLPGDEIVGYISKGKGIVVHRKDCPNVANVKERLVDVYWRKDIESATYPVDIMVEANDRDNLLINIMTVLTNAHVPVSNVHAQKTNGGTVALFSLTLLVSDAKRVNDISSILMNVRGVYEVRRIIH